MGTDLIRTYDAVVVGSGAAGYSAACRLAADGRKSVCIVTEGMTCGTSRNTGSDKQTYYKLGLGGSAPDSVRQMAADLFAGGAVDGDNALCEAALSSRCFLWLCELGVPFPCNRYGEYVGYKTDHDPYARATSAGPLTSKFMTEALERRAGELGVPIHDGLLAVEVLTDADGVCGLLCLDRASGDLVRFNCAHVILATGGPAGIYADSVYPACHNGATGLALAAGAHGQNLTEWQYGLASISPRWNVSGTYMQVLPRVISVGADGEREFLGDDFADPYAALSALFLKGYQWPFDCKKVHAGSSVIDLLVYRETVLRGRRVYLDYTRNPFDLDTLDFARLDDEAHAYLRAADACFGTPIERLAHMNLPAIELYRGKGVDLTREPLEIALCAQHNNGGIAVDAHWQTAVSGLYAIGECAGTHGVTRPGGSALNAGQVGALRAAQHVAASARIPHKETDFAAITAEQVEKSVKFLGASPTGEDADEARSAARRRMSACGGAIRSVGAMQEMRDETVALLARVGSFGGTPEARFRLRDVLRTQLAVLTAMLDYAAEVGVSRGSALYTDPQGELREGLDELFRLTVDAVPAARDRVQEIALCGDTCTAAWRPVRPMPADDDVFETVWRDYREHKFIH